MRRRAREGAGIGARGRLGIAVHLDLDQASSRKAQRATGWWHCSSRAAHSRWLDHQRPRCQWACSCHERRLERGADRGARGRRGRGRALADPGCPPVATTTCSASGSSTSSQPLPARHRVAVRRERQQVGGQRAACGGADGRQRGDAAPARRRCAGEPRRRRRAQRRQHLLHEGDGDPEQRHGEQQVMHLEPAGQWQGQQRPGVEPGELCAERRVTAPGDQRGEQGEQQHQGEQGAPGAARGQRQVARPGAEHGRRDGRVEGDLPGDRPGAGRPAAGQCSGVVPRAGSRGRRPGNPFLPARHRHAVAVGAGSPGRGRRVELGDGDRQVIAVRRLLGEQLGVLERMLVGEPLAADLAGEDAGVEGEDLGVQVRTVHVPDEHDQEGEQRLVAVHHLCRRDQLRRQHRGQRDREEQEEARADHDEAAEDQAPVLELLAVVVAAETGWLRPPPQVVAHVLDGVTEVVEGEQHGRLHPPRGDAEHRRCHVGDRQRRHHQAGGPMHPAHGVDAAEVLDDPAAAVGVRPLLGQPGEQQDGEQHQHGGVLEPRPGGEPDHWGLGLSRGNRNRCGAHGCLSDGRPTGRGAAAPAGRVRPP